MKSRQVLVIAGLLIMAAAYAQQPEAPRPQRIRVSSGVAESQLVHKVEPRYPDEARRQGIQGNVVLTGIIGKDGQMGQLKAVSGDPILVDASIKAVKQWRYRPYLLKGEPVEIETTITIKYHM
jgi:protein TonB